MEEEANLNCEDEEDDEDDEQETIADKYYFPEEWTSPASSMESMDMHKSRFWYSCNMIDVNQLFPNKQELKDTFMVGSDVTEGDVG